MGEIDKWAPISPQRVKGISWNDTYVIVPLDGAPGEQFDFYCLLQSKLAAATCKIPASGRATFKIDSYLGDALCDPS